MVPKRRGRNIVRFCRVLPASDCSHCKVKRDSPALLFVSVLFSSNRSQCTEQAVSLAIGTSAKDIDESETFTSNVIVFATVLLGVRYEKASANVLDVEGSIALRNPFIAKASFGVPPVVLFLFAFRKLYGFKVRIVDFNVAAAEICNVEVPHSLYI